MPAVTETATLGRSGVSVGRLGFGSVPLGNLYRAMTDEAAFEAVDAALEAGIAYFDTAPFYGFGLSERRLGLALGHVPRDRVVVSTKIGRTLVPARHGEVDHGIFVDAPPFDAVFDFGHDAVMRQVEDSLQRLGTNRLDCVVIHDLGLWHMGTMETVEHHFATFRGGGLLALERLKAEGVVGAIGAGANELTLCQRFIEMDAVDFILLALRYTLLDQSAFPDVLNAAQRGHTSIVVGAPFQSGILASGASPGAKVNYADVDEETLTRVRRIEEVCSAFAVPLPAAALQFPALHPAVAAVLAGMGSAEEVRRNVESMRAPIPPAFWQALKERGVLPPQTPVVEGGQP